VPEIGLKDPAQLRLRIGEIDANPPAIAGRLARDPVRPQ